MWILIPKWRPLDIPYSSNELIVKDVGGARGTRVHAVCGEGVHTQNARVEVGWCACSSWLIFREHMHRGVCMRAYASGRMRRGRVHSGRVHHDPCLEE
jgi:hypothetical protein